MEDTKNNATTTIKSFMAGRSTRVVGDVEYLGDTKGDKMTLEQAKSGCLYGRSSAGNYAVKRGLDAANTVWDAVEAVGERYEIVAFDEIPEGDWERIDELEAEMVVDVNSVEYYDQLADDELRREYREHTDMTAATRAQMDYIDRGCKAPCLS